MRKFKETHKVKESLVQKALPTTIETAKKKIRGCVLRVKPP